MKEVWKDVVGYEGLYMVSNLGRVKSLNRKVNKKHGKRTVNEKILKTQINTHGYEQLTLCKNNNKKSKTIHRLVLTAFIKNEKHKKQINHIDGNKTNNDLKNLEWCSCSENLKHAFKNNLKNPTKYWEGKTGKEHPVSKAVILMNKNYKELKRFVSIRNCEKYLRKNGYPKADNSKITACCKGYRKTHKGFKFKYIGE